MTSFPLADAALAYARMGWGCFPVTPGGKEPVVPWRDESTTDVGQIERWWTERPEANIGIDCAKSGLAVIDVDDPAGLTALVAVVGQLPATLTARTGSGGTHFVYADPAGLVKNTQSKLAPKVDTRGNGGFIVVPPSVTTGTYEWTRRVDPAPFPKAVLDLLAKLNERPSTPPASLPTEGEHVGTFSADRWGAKVLEGELGKLAVAPEGDRNGTLFRCACKVFEAVKGGHIEEPYARAQLEQVAERIGLDDDEIGKTLDSAWERTDARDPLEPLRGDAPTPAPPVVASHAPDPKAPRSFQVLDVAGLDNLPPPRWLLQARVPEGMTLLYGEPGTTKTFTSLDWALTIASQGGKVLYFAGEGHAGLSLRLKAWRLHHPQLDPTGFMVVPQCPWLADPAQVAMLGATVAQSGPSLVVIDTWARAMVGLEENSASDTSRAIGVLDELRTSYGTSCLIVHHASRGGAERGSTALRGACDAVWKIQPDDGMGFDAYKLHCEKIKDGERPSDIFTQLRKSGPSVVPYPSTPDQLRMMGGAA